MSDEIDPELIAEIDAATAQMAVTSVELTDGRSRDHYPAVLAPWGTCYVTLDFTKEQLIWLEQVMFHASTCPSCYEWVSHLCVMFTLGIIGSARVVYPAWDFPTDVELCALSSFDPDSDEAQQYIDRLMGDEGEGQEHQ